MMTAHIPAIHVEDLTVIYQDQPVLWDIDWEVPQQVLMAIVGPNGAGKTTLIQSILGIKHPSAGRIRIFGKPYSLQRKRVGYVPQRRSVDWDFPINVLDVVLMGRYGHIGWLRRASIDDRNMAMDCLETVGMADFASRQISQLSGGQQQRVFLARALAQDADLYLMDEPFVGVDAVTEKAIVSVLKSLRSEGKTVVVVHHDLQTLSDYFDSALLLNVHKIASGPIDEVVNKDTLRHAYGGRKLAPHGDHGH